MITWLILFESCLPIASKILALNLTNCLNYYIELSSVYILQQGCIQKRGTINLQNAFKKCLSIQFNNFHHPICFPKCKIS